MSKNQMLTVALIVVAYAVLLRIPAVRDVINPPAGVLDSVSRWFSDLF